MKKFLIVAHYSRFLVQFEMNNVHILQSMGYEVHYATNYENEDMYADAPERIRNEGVILHQIDFVRSPYNILANVKAYNQLVQLMEKEQFAGVHCHTPMAGVLARMAANKTKTKPVLYTAHGFHFYKGCPIQNTLIYKTAEWYFSRYTDALITINEEDYQAAKRFPLRGNAYKIPGVGVDVEKIQNLKIDRIKKRQELGIPEDAFLMVSVGELIGNKNHIVAIKAFIKANISNSYYIICGEGEAKEYLQNVINENNAHEKIHLLGFRKDIAEILKISDLFIFPSKREGLGLAAVEALAAGLPVIAADNRGSKEYYNKKVVEVFASEDKETLTNLLSKWYKEILDNKEILSYIASGVAKEFSLKKVNNMMGRIYTGVLK